MAKKIINIAASILAVTLVACLLFIPFRYASVDTITLAETLPTNTIISFNLTRNNIAGIRLFIQRSYLLQDIKNNLIVEIRDNNQIINSAVVPLKSLPVKGFQNIIFDQPLSSSEYELPIQFIIYPQFELADSESLIISLRDESVSNIDETPRIIYQDSAFSLIHEIKNKVFMDNLFANYYAIIISILFLGTCLFGILNLYPKKYLDRISREHKK